MLQYILLISTITAIKKNLKILTVTNEKGLLMFVINFFFFFKKLILFNVFSMEIACNKFFPVDEEIYSHHGTIFILLYCSTTYSIIWKFAFSCQFHTTRFTKMVLQKIF